MNAPIKILEDEIRTAYSSMIDDGLKTWLNPLSSHQGTYQIGSYYFHIDFADDELWQFFHPAINHLSRATENGIDYKVQVQIADGPSKLQTLVRSIRSNSVRGRISLSTNSNYELHYGAWENEAVAIDRKNRIAIWWLASPTHLPSWHRSFSFRKIFNLCLQTTSLQLVHAAGIQIGNVGLVITGRGGIGKSNMALTALSTGHTFYGDDFILIDSTKPIKMYTLYQIAKLHLDDLARFPKLQDTATVYQDHDKTHLALRSFSSQFGQGGDVHAVIRPIRANMDKPRIEEVESQEVWADAALSTMHLLTGSRQRLSQKINRILEGVHSFKFFMHPDSAVNIAWLEQNIAKYV